MVDDKKNKRDRTVQAWEAFLTELEKKFGSECVHKWLRTLKVLRFDAANLYLEAEDSFQANWFEEHVRPLLISFKNSNDRPIQVHLSSPQKRKEKKKNNFFSPFLSIDSDPLDPQMTLENFLPLSGNEMALRFVQQISLSAQHSFNPIFFYGSSATGKTHLLNATALAFQSLGKKVFFVHAKTFTEQLVAALRQGAMLEFRKTYRKADLLIIDDVHLFAKKSATQEEFFHTFNALHTTGNPIILSSHLSPSFLTDIEPRLISRFEWGITIALPDLKKKEILSVLEKKLNLMELNFTEEAKSFLLEKFSYHLKKIHGALQALLLRNNPLPPKIDSTILIQSLADLLEQEEKTALNADSILQAVAHHFGIRIEDILGTSHARDYSLPRQVAMYFCRQKLKMPYMKIGDLFERDHSTVMTSIKSIARMQEKKEELLSTLLEIARSFEKT